MGVSGAFAHVLCRLWVLLPVIEVVVFMTFPRSPRLLATNKVKMIDRRDANRCQKAIRLARSSRSEGRGFKSYSRTRIFSRKISKVSDISPKSMLVLVCDGVQNKSGKVAV